MFVLFRLLDFMFLMGTPPELNRSLLSSTITGGLWTTALLIAIAMRKAWARLILLALLGLAAVFTIIVLPLAFDYPSLWMPLGAFLLVNAGSFAWLSYSRDVRRLISRDRE